jgi:hypothetical protein
MGGIAEPAEELELGFFHIAKVVGEVNDPRHIGLGELNSAFGSVLEMH